MSDQFQRIEVEISLAVADYLNVAGPDAALKRSATDTNGALSAAREHLLYEMDAADAARVQAVSAAYLETDAANPSHACAIYRVLLDVPTDIAEAVKAAFSLEDPTPRSL
ncbi:hypothetical protein WDZ92_45145 [Nostoc sp. NIES-2111]